MTTFLEMSVTLDGFVAGPDVSLEQPLGAGGEIVHDWMETEPELAEAMLVRAGAFVVGRRMFDVGIQHWGEEGAFGKPVFVVTHRSGPAVVRGATTFTFVPGVEAALAGARHAAGGADVCVVGGGDIARQVLAAGLVDELNVHVVPHLLGAGTPLFAGAPVALERIGVTEGAAVTHLRCRVVR